MSGPLCPMVRSSRYEMPANVQAWALRLWQRPKADC